MAKTKFSGSTDGKNIKIAATSTPGTTIHTAHASAIEEIWLWVTNSDASERKVTIEFGGTASPDDLIEFTVPSEDGPYLLIPGWPLTNSAVVRGFAATGNVIVVNGYINRIT